MEKRKSERIQLFQYSPDMDLAPVWDFDRVHPNSTLGILRDVSDGGAQILTDKSSPLLGKAYRLIIHDDESMNGNTMSVQVHRLWSKTDCIPYICNGFTSNGDHSFKSAMETLLAVRNTDQSWVRCELAEV